MASKKKTKTARGPKKTAAVPARRGRPPGSKNKVKNVAAPARRATVKKSVRANRQSAVRAPEEVRPAFKAGDTISWVSRGPYGKRRRLGTVVAFCPPKANITRMMPKGADRKKFKAQAVNLVHNRYLIEIERTDARNGRELASTWMASKVVTLDAIAQYATPAEIDRAARPKRTAGRKATRVAARAPAAKPAKAGRRAAKVTRKVGKNTVERRSAKVGGRRLGDKTIEAIAAQSAAPETVHEPVTNGVAKDVPAETAQAAAA
jgi:hypothetical protein